MNIELKRERDKLVALQSICSYFHFHVFILYLDYKTYININVILNIHMYIVLRFDNYSYIIVLRGSNISSFSKT